MNLITVLIEQDYHSLLDGSISVQQCDGLPCARSGQYFSSFLPNYFFSISSNKVSILLYLFDCTDGRVGREVVEGASRWCAGRCLPLSFPSLAPAVVCRLGSWSDFCLRRAQHSFTPRQSAREREVWLGLPSFSFHDAHTRDEPHFHITFNNNIWQKCINVVTFVSGIYGPWCEVSVWQTSVNIGPMRVAENCQDASLSLCSNSPWCELPWQTSALWLSACLEIPFWTPYLVTFWH